MSAAEALGLTSPETAGRILRAGLASTLLSTLHIFADAPLLTWEIAGCRFVHAAGALTLICAGEWEGRPAAFANVASRARRDVPGWVLLAWSPSNGSCALWNQERDDDRARELSRAATTLQNEADALREELGGSDESLDGPHTKSPRWQEADRAAYLAGNDLRAHRRTLALAAIGEALLAAETRVADVPAPEEGL